MPLSRDFKKWMARADFTGDLLRKADVARCALYVIEANGKKLAPVLEKSSREDLLAFIEAYQAQRAMLTP